MTRNFLMTTTTIATLIAAPMANASEDSMVDLQGNSPAVTEGAYNNTAGSTANGAPLDTKRPGIGIAAYGKTTMTMTEAEYNALVGSIGTDFETSDGELLGTVENVTFDAQGNPEMVIDLLADAKIDAETLVITLLPESVEVTDNMIKLDTSADELYLMAQQGSKRDDETRTTVVVM